MGLQFYPDKQTDEFKRLEFNIHRDLVGTNLSATQSTFTTGATTILVNTTYTVLATVKNTSGVSVGVGGDNVLIKITNQWTASAGNRWDPVASPDNIIATPISELMTDLGNSSYSYSYTVTKPGTFTIQAYLLQQGGLYAESFGNTNFGGTPANIAWMDLSHNFGWDVYSGAPTNSSTLLDGYLLAPATASYTFKLHSDDGSDLYINGDRVINREGVQGDFVDTLTPINLVQDTLYSIKVRYVDINWWAILKLKWSYNSVVQEFVPTNLFYGYRPIQGSPWNINSACPAGYYEDDPNDAWVKWR